MYLILFSGSVHFKLMLQNAIMLWWISCKTNVITTINSFWSSDNIWWQRSGSTLAEVMACCQTAPSHYLTQCWLIISKLQLTFKIGQFHKRCMPQPPPITKICLKNTYLKFHSNFPGANELKIISPIQINKIHHLHHIQLTHPSKANLDDFKGNGGLHYVDVTSQ